MKLNIFCKTVKSRDFGFLMLRLVPSSSPNPPIQQYPYSFQRWVGQFQFLNACHHIHLVVLKSKWIDSFWGITFHYFEESTQHYSLLDHNSQFLCLRNRPNTIHYGIIIHNSRVWEIVQHYPSPQDDRVYGWYPGAELEPADPADRAGPPLRAARRRLLPGARLLAHALPLGGAPWIRLPRGRRRRR